MRIDKGSLAFNIDINGRKGGTPSWGTAIVYQNQYNKIKESVVNDILMGVIYKMIDCTSEKLSLRLGKGGRVYYGNEDFTTNGAPAMPCLAAKFEKTYVNGKSIGKPFVVLVMKDGYEAHNGRLQLKYSPSISWDGYANQEFFDEVFNVLEIDADAPLLCYDIEVLDQDIIHFRCAYKKNKYEFKDNNEYLEFIEKAILEDDFIDEEYKNLLKSAPLQTIYYGTPGSGKSHKVKEMVEGVDDNFVFRTTFHPDSDYASFVGCYKPKTSCVKNHQLKKTLDELKTEAKDITSQPAGNKVSQIIDFVTKYATIFPKIVEENDDVQSMQHLLRNHLGFTNETYLTYIVDYVIANQKQESKISYEFTPQTFTKAYVKAWQNPEEQVYLIIEEINRGNCAQIFGDLFQLLDRKNGVSEYPIDADNDLKDYLEKELGVGHEGIANGKLKLPANLNIIATMNTSDQSLFPMDSAFKRRWSWKCVPVDYKNLDSEKFTIKIADDKEYNWHKFLRIINKKIKDITDSEDKQMGNFFITGDIDKDQFVDKVMFYLWNDIFKEEYNTSRNHLRYKKNESDNETVQFSFNDLFGKDSTNMLIGFMEYIMSFDE